MNRAVFILIVFFLPFFAKAQETTKNFHLGFTVSPNISWATINDGSDKFSPDGSRFGISYGVVGDFGFAKNYYFSTGFILTNINSKIKADGNFSEDGFSEANNIYKIQYVEIPLTLKLKTNGESGKSFYGQFGLGTGVKTRAKADVELLNQSGGAISRDKNSSISSETNVFRFGSIAGAGLQWNYSENSKITTGVTLNNGFTKVLDDHPDFQSTYLALNLALFF